MGIIRKFIDFPEASGGITSTNNLFITSESDIFLQANNNDPANENVRPSINITERNNNDRIDMYVDAEQQNRTDNIRPRVDAGSGLMPVCVASGLFYGVSNTLSGVPTAASAFGVVPWETSINPDDVHFSHHTNNAAINTHVTVMLDGWYSIAYGLTFYKNANNTRVTVDTRCRINNTVDLPGARSFCDLPLINNGETAVWSGFVRLKAGDVVTVVCKELLSAAGDVFLLNDAASLKIKYEGPCI